MSEQKKQEQLLDVEHPRCATCDHFHPPNPAYTGRYAGVGFCRRLPAEEQANSECWGNKPEAWCGQHSDLEKQRRNDFTEAVAYAIESAIQRGVANAMPIQPPQRGVRW